MSTEEPTTPPPPPPHLTTTKNVEALLQRTWSTSHDLWRGLNGTPFTWYSNDRRARLPLLTAIGLTLATRTQIRRMGLELKPRARPVGTVYFNAPISRLADVYIVECQCKAPTPAPPERVLRAGIPEIQA